MRPTGKRRYRYVTPAENELMHSLYNAGVSMAEIARRLNRHPGSVDRILHFLTFHGQNSTNRTMQVSIVFVKCFV